MAGAELDDPQVRAASEQLGEVRVPAAVRREAARS